jgi:hypothetical protein
LSIIGEPLFFNRNHADVGDIARHHQSKLKEAVDRVSQSDFDAKSDAEVIAIVAEDMRLHPLEVDFDAAQKRVEETTTNVRDSFSFDEGTVRVPALKATKTIPFKGDGGFWRIMTGTWSTTMPYGEVRGQTLIVGIVVRADRTDEAKQHIDSTIKEIQKYLPQQCAKIDDYNNSLPALIRPLVEARRSRRNQAAELLGKL